eukprot:5456984-Alexandrium_andersonii.AAC.1
MADVSTSEKKRKVKAEMGKDTTHEEFDSVAEAFGNWQPAAPVHGRPSSKKKKGGKPTPGEKGRAGQDAARH